MEGNYLKFIDFKDIEAWDVKRQNLQKNTFKFLTIKLSEILSKTQIEWINIQDDKKYPILGVRANGKGVYINRIANGNELKMKRYQKSKQGLLFYCKVRTVNGQWGIVYPEYENTYASSNMQYLQVNYEKINPKFLELILSVRKITSEWDKNAIGVDGRHFTLSTLLNLEIPLPTIKEQQAIVESYFTKINKANQLEVEANNIDQEIEKYLFTELGISTGNKIEKSKGLNLVEFSRLERWGVEYNLNSSNSLLSSKSFSNKRLKDILLINPTTTLPKVPNLPISFIPMEVVSDDYGIVTELRNKTVLESKGYTKFMEGDLIWARITPCMQNGKSAIVKNLKNGLGVGSTEFHVLRNENANINLDYIYHLLRLDIVLKDAMSHFTGSAGQQRVPKTYLEELLIPIPEYKKQTEISNHLYQLKDLKMKLFNKVKQLKYQANKEFEEAIFQ